MWPAQGASRQALLRKRLLYRPWPEARQRPIHGRKGMAMTPADLAALRALIEAVDLQTYRRYHDLSYADPPSYHDGDHGSRLEDCSRCLERRDEDLLRLVPAAQEALERLKSPEGCEVCGHRKGAQQTGPRSPWAIKVADAEARIAKFEQEWRRAAQHGATAQAERDVAHWRKRAETAEALAAWQEARIARLEAALEHVAEYWNGHETEAAMKDACEHVVLAARAALEGRDE